MAAALLRLLTLMAMMLMPFGMTSAPAAAAPVAHHAAAAGHCGEQPRPHEAPAPKQADCTMTCSALPATGEPLFAPPLRPKTPRVIANAIPFDDVELEIATPPPRQA